MQQKKQYPEAMISFFDVRDFLQDAIEKCTGQKVAIYDVKEMDKAMKRYK